MLLANLKWKQAEYETFQFPENIENKNKINLTGSEVINSLDDENQE